MSHTLTGSARNNLNGMTKTSPPVRDSQVAAVSAVKLSTLGVWSEP